MASLFDALSLEYRLLALDLPGYGPATPPRSCSLPSGASVEDAIEFYAAALEAFLERRRGGERVYVVAHSLGGFYALHHAVRHPLRVDRMLLADPAGLLSTLGTKGAAWGYFFKHSLTNFPRAGGAASLWVMGLLLHALGASGEAHYWLSVLGSPRGWGDRVLGMLISLGWSHAHWTRPALAELATLSARGLPLLLVHGSKDDIMPAHQGDLMRLLLGVPNRRLEGAGHSPHGTDAPRFVQMVTDFGREGDGRSLSGSSTDGGGAAGGGVVGGGGGAGGGGGGGGRPCAGVPRLGIEDLEGMGRYLCGAHKALVHTTPFHGDSAARTIASLYRSLLERCPGREGVEVPPLVRDSDVLPE